jgi:hypothetical protein
MTPVVAEGLALTPEPSALVAEDAAALAEPIVRMHGDARANRRAGKAGLALVRTEFSTARVTAARSAAVTPPQEAITTLRQRA